MIPRSALALAVFLALAAVAACGEVVEPEGFSIAPPDTVEGDAAAADDEVDPEVAGVSSASSTSVPEFVPSIDDYVPEILVSSEDDLLVAGADGLTEPLDTPVGSVSATTAVDDFLGGLVVQAAAPGAAAGPGPVLWLPAEGGEPVVVDDEGALLLDVGFDEGAATAVVLVNQDQIDLIRLVDDERGELVGLGEEEELLDLSAGGGIHALVVRNDRCGDLRFYAADGNEIDLNGPGEPDCIVPRRPAYGAVALSPDGGAMVYTEVSYRDDGIEVGTDLVARELSTGTEYYRRPIGEDGERIESLSFDGNRAAFLLRSDGTATATLIDLNTETVIPVDLTGITGVGSLSFARLPLAGS